MTGASRARGMSASVLAAALASILLTADADAQGIKRLLGMGKTDEYLAFEPADKRFTVDIPKRDWRTVPGVGSVIVVFSDAKSDASVALEHVSLKLALEPSEINQLFVDLEVESIKERDPSADGVRTALKTDPDGSRVIVIDFTHKGLRGPERVRQFSLPRGGDLYRLICSAAPAQFDRVAPVFEHMAESFKIGSGTVAVK